MGVQLPTNWWVCRFFEPSTVYVNILVLTVTGWGVDPTEKKIYTYTHIYIYDVRVYILVGCRMTFRWITLEVQRPNCKLCLATARGNDILTAWRCVPDFPGFLGAAPSKSAWFQVTQLATHPPGGKTKASKKQIGHLWLSCPTSNICSSWIYCTKNNREKFPSCQGWISRNFRCYIMMCMIDCWLNWA